MGLKELSIWIGRALHTICLQSHLEKTEALVSGRTKAAADMRVRLTADPVQMQGHRVKVTSSAMYLGMKVSKAGYRETIHEMVKHRVTKAWARVKEIKMVINHPRMKVVGWLKAGFALIKAVIIPALTYSCETWTGMYRYTQNYIEAEFKSMIYVILDIGPKTKFTSVLADLESCR